MTTYIKNLPSFGSLLSEIENTLRHKKGGLVIFLLGGTDVGKTFTGRQIAKAFPHLKVAIVDADIGQSDIGPPGCIGTGIYEDSVETLSDVPLREIFFIGAISPYGLEKECTEGISKAVRDAKVKLGADLIIVDTTGWIYGIRAKKFKLSEIKSADADIVVAIEKGRELEHIISDLLGSDSDVMIMRLRASRDVEIKSREKRRYMRNLRWSKYFERGRTYVLHVSSFRNVSPRDLRRGTILGIFRRNECIGVGILENVDHDSGIVEIFTPVSEVVESEGDIIDVKLGKMQLEKSEEGYREKGKKS